MNKANLTSLIKEVLIEHIKTVSTQKNQLKESIKRVILESIEEIKTEKQDGIFEIVEELRKEVTGKYKEAVVCYDDSKNITVNCGKPHFFRISPQYKDNFNVEYFKDGVTRTKTLNLDIDKLKEFIKDKLTSKEAGYVPAQYNKCVKNNEDKKEENKSEGLPKHDILTKKEVKDTKNDNKDYNEKAVTKKEDMPDAPLNTVEKFKKQNEHPIKGTKPEYTFPKQKDKKLVIKQKSKKNLKKLG